MKNYPVNKGKRVLKIGFLILIVISATTFPPSEILAQNVDSLIEVINHSGSYKAIDNAKDKIPVYLRKVDLQLLDVSRQMKSHGITRSNASDNNVHKKFSTPLVEVNDQGNFHVKIYLKQLDDQSISKLNGLGITIQSKGKKYQEVTCWAPFDIIDALAKDDNVGCISNVGKPYVKTANITAGDTLLHADAARSTFGINGSGIKVGVISSGAYNYQDAITAHYLNSSLFHNDSPGYSQDNEGTAMSEIVHVLAPGADIHFEEAGEGFVSDINDLESDKQCKVIVDDIGFGDEPMFEDGENEDKVNNATSNYGVIYISSAGNNAQTTWNGMSTHANNSTWMEFSGTDETNTITVPGSPGSGKYYYIDVILQWANKWFNSRDDFDLYLFDGPNPTDSVLTSSVNYQDGNNYCTPYEYKRWVNYSTSPKTVYIRVKLRSVSASREVMLVLLNSSGSLFHVQGGHIWGHAAAESCISVGAINSSDGQSIENFSSLGQARKYEYDANGYPTGNPQYTDYPTPTICGIDGVETYIGMSGI